MNTLPKTGFSGLKAHYKEDLMAGFSVSLIALPLSLGIAIASGFPPLAGLIAAIVGGLFFSHFSGTFVTISGPAAGLIVLSLGAAESMGGAGAEAGYAGYPHALGAIVIAGLIVVAFGFLKSGKIGDFFPSAAVHGMLAAIGIIIITKQLFPALGVASPKGEILEIMTEIPHAFLVLNSYAATIALVALGVLIGFPYLPSKTLKALPAPMWVLLLTIPLAQVMGTGHLDLVKLPHSLLGEGGITFPSFEKIGEGVFWSAVVGIALVSAIESLLSAKAVEGLDPYQRKSNLDKNLIAMGGASSLAALLGGLPMISEIVRSSANINSGAKTAWSNFFHSAFILVYLLLAVAVIELIPVAALAAMLVFTGFKLASPQEFRKMFQIGLMEFEIFVVTLLAVLATDLVVGIALGIIFKYILLLTKGVKPQYLFKAHAALTQQGDIAMLQLRHAQIFSNYLSLKKKMDNALKNSRILELDFTEVSTVDHTVMEHLEEYAQALKLQGKELHLVNIDNLNPVSAHPLAERDRNSKKVRNFHHLSERQIRWFDYACQNQYTYINQTKNWEDWAFYTLSIRKKILAVENLIKLTHNTFELTLADLTSEEGSMITAHKHTSTVVRIRGFKELPKFYMQKTSAIDNALAYFGERDIDFETHPNFSKHFILRAEGNEEVVRQIFNPDLLTFLEDCEECLLVSNGKDLLLHKSILLHQVDEVELLIKEAKKITMLIESSVKTYV